MSERWMDKMTKILLLFGSTTGNTEDLSEHVAAGLDGEMADVMVKNVTEAGAEEMRCENCF